MNLDHPKQFHTLGGLPILIHTIKAFSKAECIDSIIIVVPAGWQKTMSDLLEKNNLSSPSISIIIGGKRRQDSVFEGLKSVSEDTEIALIHDGARPLVSRQLITRCYKKACTHGAAIAALPVKDTLKRSSPNLTVDSTVDRKQLWQAQTPQAVQINLLKKAYQVANDKNVTDEASLLELAKIPVHLVEGSETNFKITRPEDLILAEKILMTPPLEYRTGHGYDAHGLVEGRKLILGGIEVPHSKGLQGHSDADVLTHALCDALLGAMGAGDLGNHFPDSDPKYLNISSLLLLQEVTQKATTQGYSLSNADITLICQSPKIASFIPSMKKQLALACDTSMERINIKATTTERMGFAGREEGVSCHAVVLLSKARPHL